MKGSGGHKDARPLMAPHESEIRCTIIDATFDDGRDYADGGETLCLGGFRAVEAHDGFIAKFKAANNCRLFVFKVALRKSQSFTLGPRAKIYFQPILIALPDSRNSIFLSREWTVFLLQNDLIREKRRARMGFEQNADVINFKSIDLLSTNATMRFLPWCRFVIVVLYIVETYVSYIHRKYNILHFSVILTEFIVHYSFTLSMLATRKCKCIHLFQILFITTPFS